MLKLELNSGENFVFKWNLCIFWDTLLNWPYFFILMSLSSGVQKGNKIHIKITCRWDNQQDWGSCKTSWLWCAEEKLQGKSFLSNNLWWASLLCL